METTTEDRRVEGAIRPGSMGGTIATVIQAGINDNNSQERQTDVVLACDEIPAANSSPRREAVAAVELIGFLTDMVGRMEALAIYADPAVREPLTPGQWMAMRDLFIRLHALMAQTERRLA